MIAKIIIISWTAFIAWGFITGLNKVFDGGPTDFVLSLTVMFSIAFHLGLWLIVALPTYMISRLFARKNHAPSPPSYPSASRDDLVRDSNASISSAADGEQLGHVTQSYRIRRGHSLHHRDRASA